MKTNNQYCYDYPRPTVTVDIGVFRWIQGFVSHFSMSLNLEFLLIKRKKNPFKDTWALPGGFLDLKDENCEAAAARELFEETNIKVEPAELKLSGVYSDLNRDPRDSRVITVAYRVIVSKEIEAIAGDDAKEATWHSTSKINDIKFAFDHEKILKEMLAQEGVKLP